MPKTKLPPPRARMLADLSRSGLTPKSAAKLKTAALDASVIQRLTKKAGTAGYKLPYFTLDGRMTPFYRIKLFDAPRGFKVKRPMKYWQPPDTLPRLYIPPFAKWRELAKDVDQTVLITEGEKKAACATLRGVPCLGLGGVWSWKSRKAGVALIEDFKLFEWKGRRVVIVFDSDANEKPEVQVALVALARELIKLGALIFSIKLPHSDGEKIGLDDFLIAHGVEALRALDQGEPVGGLSEALWAMNDELAYIEEAEAIYRLKTGKLLNRQQLVSIAYAHRNVTVFADGAKPKELNVATEWLKWPHRRTHRRLTYAPGEPAVVERESSLNLWRGWGAEPQRGPESDVALFNELIDHLFAKAPEYKEWFMRWLAYPLQQPGTKLYTAAVFFSLESGIGKSLLGLTMGQIYGSNFRKVNQSDLHSDFNAWAINKQFVLGDEITGSDKRNDADRLKDIITRTVVTINQKHQPIYDIPDCINYLFTTQHPDAFFLDDKDRRYFIVEVLGDPKPQSFYDAYDAWLWIENGPAKLFYHLTERIDCSEFNPKARAPFTLAKRDMIELSASDLDLWARAVREDPDGALRVDNVPLKRDLWTIEELRGVVDPEGVRKTSLIALSKALRRAGHIRLEPTNTCDGLRRLWALRDVKRWRAALHHERANEYERTHAAKAVEKHLKVVKY